MKKEPTNADIMAELKRQGAKVDRLSAVLEGALSQTAEPPREDPFRNVLGLSEQDRVRMAEARGGGPVA